MDGYENKVENGLTVNDNDKMIYYGAKAWVGEKLDTSEQNAANQSFGNVLHDDILGTYKSSDAKSVNNDIKLLAGLDSGLAGDVNSTFAGIRETERNQKLIQENQYLADFKELDRSKTDAYIAQQGNESTLRKIDATLIAGLIIGIDKYNEFQDAREASQKQQEALLNPYGEENKAGAAICKEVKDGLNDLSKYSFGLSNGSDDSFLGSSYNSSGVILKAASVAFPNNFEEITDPSNIDGIGASGKFLTRLGEEAVEGIATRLIKDVTESKLEKAILDEAEDVTNAITKVGGRLPINSKYAGNTYEVSGDLANKYPNGVTFKDAGFPDFTPYSKASIEIKGLTGNYTVDSAKANKLIGVSETPANYVWHHVEDGRTMELIPKDLHSDVKHTGGSAVIRSEGK